jgi:hypothetical protein
MGSQPASPVKKSARSVALRKAGANIWSLSSTPGRRLGPCQMIRIDRTVDSRSEDGDGVVTDQ